MHDLCVFGATTPVPTRVHGVKTRIRIETAAISTSHINRTMWALRVKVHNGHGNSVSTRSSTCLASSILTSSHIYYWPAGAD